MKYVIDIHSTDAAYLQLYKQIKNDIVNGIFSYGTKLPSKRLLSEESGVSVITTAHAYEILCEEGYIESRQRSGYFVIYREDDFVSTTEAVSSVASPVVHASSVGKNVFPFSILAKTMRKVLLDYEDEILVKSPNHGCMELRTAISSYLARSNGMMIDPKQIIVGSGAEYLYNMLVQLLGRNKIYAIENPCYEKIKQVYQSCFVKYDALKMGKDGITSAELSRTKATILHVTPFNSYPSNVTASASKRKEYIRWAKERNGYIIEDNYDSELTISKKNADTLFSLSDDENIIYLNTFSMTIAPSIRVGYMVLPQSLLSVYEEKLGFYSCTVPVFEQYVLAKLLDSGDFERHINRVRRKKRKQKQHLVI